MCLTLLYLLLINRPKINSNKPADWWHLEDQSKSKFSRYPAPKIVIKSFQPTSVSLNILNRSKSDNLVNDSLSLHINLESRKASISRTSQFQNVSLASKFSACINTVLKKLLSKSSKGTDFRSYKSKDSNLTDLSLKNNLIDLFDWKMNNGRIGDQTISNVHAKGESDNNIIAKYEINDDLADKDDNDNDDEDDDEEEEDEDADDDIEYNDD